MTMRALQKVIKRVDSHQLKEIALPHKTQFNLGRVSIIVKSNSNELLQEVEQTFQFYPSQNEMVHKKKCVTIEIYCFGKGIRGTDVDVLPPWDDTVFFDKNNFDEKDFSNDGFILHKQQSTEYFWRPNDLTIRVPDSDDDPIRMLISNDDAIQLNFEGKPYFESIGANGFPDNIVEIVDLIKILYTRVAGQYCLHGATVAANDKGILITGDSGNGKTTTALAATRDGFDLLSDELTLVTKDAGNRCKLQGLLIPPSIVGSPPPNLKMLEATLSAPIEMGKHPYILSESTVKMGLNRTVEPKVILVLKKPERRRTHHATSRMPDYEALNLLLNQTLDFNCSFRIKERFEAVSSLVASCPAYYLVPGRDLSSIPSLLGTFL